MRESFLPRWPVRHAKKKAGSSCLDELPASEIGPRENVEAGIAVRSVARADESGLGSIQTEVHSSLDANRRLVFVRPVKHDAFDKDSCFGI
jgi:hypothetical protein